MDARDDDLRRDGAQAFQRLGETARVFHAGNAGQLELQYPLQLTVRPGAPRFRRTEQRQDRLAERGGDVHWAGVVGNHQLTEADPFDHFGQ